jgi:hypothetical protein
MLNFGEILLSFACTTKSDFKMTTEMEREFMDDSADQKSENV